MHRLHVCYYWFYNDLSYDLVLCSRILSGEPIYLLSILGIVDASIDQLGLVWSSGLAQSVNLQAVKPKLSGQDPEPRFDPE